MDWRHEQIVKRLAGQGIETTGFSILIDDTVLNGEPIEGACLSADGRFVCVPVHDEAMEVATGEFCYKPQCFEVVGAYETFCSNGAMAYSTQIRLLRC